MRMVTAAVAAILLAGPGLVACSPVQVMADNPKDGTTYELVENQGLRLRLTNQSAAASWVMETPPAGAVSLAAAEVKPPEGGALGLQYYDFVAARPGSDQITFARRAEGAPASPDDERFTIVVAVEGE